MDIFDQIHIPSFEKDRRTGFRRNFAIAAGCVGLFYALEQYNGTVSRTWESFRRGVTAAIAAWLEDRGGSPLFGLEGEESPRLFEGALDLNGLCGLRLSHDGDANAAAATLLEVRRQQHAMEAIATTPQSSEAADVPGPTSGAAHSTSADTPNFFQSTKFFACLDVEEARELFRATKRVVLAPHEVLFRSGDPSDTGIFIVLHGTLGVFLEEPDRTAPPIHANTLRSGESVGDLDVVDGAARTVSCMALEAGCTLVNVPRSLFMEFVRSHPRALMLYLQQGLARLWRVAHFVLADFLQLQLYRPKRATADGGLAGAVHGVPPLPRRTLSNLFGRERGTQTDDSMPPPPSPPPPPPIQPDQRAVVVAATAAASGDLLLRPSSSAASDEEGRRGTAQVGPVFAASAVSQPQASMEWDCEAAAPLGPVEYYESTETRLVPATLQDAGLGAVPGSAASSEPTFNELLASAAASARSRCAGRPTHGPLRPEAPQPAPSQAAAAAASLLPHVPPPPVIGPGASIAGARHAPELRQHAGVETMAGGAEGRKAGEQPWSAAGPPPGASSPSCESAKGAGLGARRASWVLPGRKDGAATSSNTDLTPSRPEGPVCRRLPDRSHSLRRSFVLGARACLAAGWDVIDVAEAAFDDSMWSMLSDPRSGVGSQLPLAAGGMLQDMDWASGCFYLLIDGHLLAERPAGPPGGGAPEELAGGAAGAGPRQGAVPVLESGLISPGSLISCAAFLSSTAARCKVVALEPCRLVAFSWQTLEALLSDQPDLLLRLLVAASAALGPVIRRFISLGLNRVWLESGDVAYRQGDFAECLYVVISGRLRLLHEALHPVTHAKQLHLEEEVGRGEAVGAVWAITGGHHDTTALCVRDSELVRMSRSAFRVISADSPLALSKLFSNIARRLVAAWDSRIRSDRSFASSNGPATGGPTDSGGLRSPTLAMRVMGNAPGGGGMQQLPNPAHLGLTPLKSTGRLAGGGSVVRGPRPPGRRGEIVTIAILPAGQLPEGAATAAMASALSGSPTDVAAAAAALAAAEAASMGGGGAAAGSGTGPAGSSPGLFASASASGPQWRCPPGMGKQASALATLTAIKRLSGALKDALSPFGPVLLLDATVLSLQFPTACERLDVLFYRSKVTSWMAAQEEEYRFILLEADVAASPWSSVCVAQADCILLVAPEGSMPELSQPESLLVFNAASPAVARSKSGRSGLTPVSATPASAAAMTPSASSAHLAAATAATAAPSSEPRYPVPPPRANTAVLPGTTCASRAAAQAPGSAGPTLHPHQQLGLTHQQLYGAASSAAMLRRVELVRLHSLEGSAPSGTAEWLARRPSLSRHHHIRLGRLADIQRLARWVAGKAVGIVLSGGGSRGLAHLGVLTALEDAGVPLDAVGGTSQGAFMAALYAQGLSREALNHSVRHYAAQLGSVRHLLSDITLPVLSLFSGAAFDEAVKKVFARGAQRLEDLWLPYFCVTTNLTRGEASVHTEGLLWKLVRASTTIVGLLPPVWEDGCLLVDGGYMNNMPVDVMRNLMGVESVLVVDVEGRDDMGWRNLTPYDGGLSGWRLLWDRLCPFPRWRFAASGSPDSAGRPGSLRPPRYGALIAKLTCMTHAANLKRVAVEHRIDLYLCPPGIGGYKLMDYHLTDRIVKDAYRYATSAITQWKSNHRVGPFGIEETPPPPPAATKPAPMAAPAQVLSAPATTVASAAAAVAVPMAMGAAGSGVAAPVAGPPSCMGPGAAAAMSSCMSQLQKKQQPPAAVLAAVTASVSGSLPLASGPCVPTPPPQRTPAEAPVVRPQMVYAAATSGSSAPDARGPTNAGGLSGLAQASAQAPAHEAVHTYASQGRSATSPSRRVMFGAEAERRSLKADGTADGWMVTAAPVDGGSGKGTADGYEDKCAAGNGERDEVHKAGVCSPPSVGSPPSPGLRTVASRMSRSTTRRSLLDMI